jgi:hypothetical protein
MSYFTGEALEKFQAMCAEGIDFSEGEAYNFVQCLMPNGDVYGVEPGEKCTKGKQISEKQVTKLKKKGDTNTRMAALKQAFLKKTGRKMTPEEAKKASWLAANMGAMSKKK